MNLQTQLMRHGAKKRLIAKENKDGWSATEYVNHPPPSGSERWLPTVSDNRIWPDAKTAKRELKKDLLEVDKAFAKAIPDIFGEKASGEREAGDDKHPPA